MLFLIKKKIIDIVKLSIRRCLVTFYKWRLGCQCFVIVKEIFHHKRGFGTGDHVFQFLGNMTSILTSRKKEKNKLLRTHCVR